ncbi:universal stress protein [soil metagenome]
MTPKTILVSLNDICRNAVLLDVAGELAEQFDAHVIGHYVIPSIEIYGADGLAGPLPVVFEGRRDYFRNLTEFVKSLFDERITGQGLRGQFEKVDSDSSDTASVLVEHGRRGDLIIISQTSGDSGIMLEADFVERVVLGTGRPALVIPRSGKCKLKDEVAIIGWNNTREATRAAYDSVPLLKLAREVRIVWVDPVAEFLPPGPMPGFEIAEALTRHGVQMVVEPLATGGLLDAGQALLQKANDEGGFVVMGAYGHSRLRELVLGGATRSILDAMTCPVFFSH